MGLKGTNESISYRQFLPDYDIPDGKNFLKEVRMVKVIGASRSASVISSRHWSYRIDVSYGLGTLTSQRTFGK